MAGSRTLPVLLALAALHGLARASPEVKIALRTSWSAPPLLLEIIESVAAENTDAFFPLLDALTDPERLGAAKPTTPEATHEFALQTAQDAGLLSPALRPIVEANVALHAAAPKIEAFYQHHDDVRRGVAGGETCEAWVDWYGEVICDYDTLVRLVGHETIDAVAATGSSKYSSLPRPKTLSFDHVYPPSTRTSHRPDHTAILYGAPSAKNFRELHTYLLGLAAAPSPRVEYIFRHAPSANRDTTLRSYLSGYGVALDLKKMEYLALDDRRTSHSDAKDVDAADDVDVVDTLADPVTTLLAAYPLNDALDASVPLTEDELMNIGAQATQLITSSGSPLSILRHLSQSFPAFASALARRVTVSDEVEEELLNNGMLAQKGMNAVWLNGAPIEGEPTPFSLLRVMRKERAIVSALTALGLEPGQAVSLITHPAFAEAQSSGGVLDGMFDASDRSEGGELIMWWNDIEKDSRYERWNPSITALLRPMYPGQFHQVKINLFNVVLAVDLSQTSNLNFIGSAVSTIISRGFPFRFGIVPIAESEDGKKMARLFKHLVDRYGRVKAMSVIKTLAHLRAPPDQVKPTVDWNLAYNEYVRVVHEPPAADVEVTEEEEVTPAPQFEDVLNSSDADAYLDAAKVWAQRLGANLESSPKGHVFVNGKHFDMDDDFLKNMQMEIQAQLMHLQEAVYSGDLGDAQADQIPNYFYDLPTSSKRRNQYIYPDEKKNALRIATIPELFVRENPTSAKFSFVNPEHAKVVPASVHVVADLDSESGLQIVGEALKSVLSSGLMRVSFIHNPSDSTRVTDSKQRRTSTLVSHLLASRGVEQATPAQLLAVLGLPVPQEPAGEHAQKVLSQQEALEQLMGGITVDTIDVATHEWFTKASGKVVQELGLAPGQQAVLVNGRVIGPIAAGGFVEDDFIALVNFEMRKRISPVMIALGEIEADSQPDKAQFSDLVAMASAVVSGIQVPDPTEMGLFNKPARPRSRGYQAIDGQHTGFTIGDSSTATYHFGIILDPLSEGAQKWSSVLEWLTSLPGVYVEVKLNPGMHKEVPLKRFYRYNLLRKLSFTEDGEESQAAVVFSDLPTQPIYTLAMDVPQSWLVRPREAQHDLDNIQLGHLQADENVEAVFELDYLVVEGHAREPVSNAPPRGLQLELIDGAGTAVDDTQVVANLGYIQFQATPGVFHLRIREGRGREIFRMESVGNEGWDSATVDVIGDEITVTDFEGLTIYPRLARLPGKELDDVLQEPFEEEEEEEKPTGILEKLLSKISAILKPKVTDTDVIVAKPGSEQAEINIFTVASGLLYERFASIMVLSVLKNTKSTVKFWFIENFLSPAFLEFIPHFAAEYNFQYELVTYKWPSWLRAQTEKQRIIWAYKILFLDVLFPMDLKKVIFVDADQIVRTDMKELNEVDLHGAPYGYTPMGDDNTDMEGFRFWKTGYWKDFLRGKPYHISALYVVDLVRFRQIAAGDMLRGSYQQLSADPNSLANLDQDLPNNLQREVPIFSLGEDWLWCETWCSKDRLHRAKTIDLCQNPLTKEPKLARARAIPEWESYDSEIAGFTRRLAEEGKIQSTLATSDINALAGEAKKDAPAADAAGEGEGEHRKDEL